MSVAKEFSNVSPPIMAPAFGERDPANYLASTAAPTAQAIAMVVHQLLQKSNSLAAHLSHIQSELNAERQARLTSEGEMLLRSKSDTADIRKRFQQLEDKVNASIGNRFALAQPEEALEREERIQEKIIDIEGVLQKVCRQMDELSKRIQGNIGDYFRDDMERYCERVKGVARETARECVNEQYRLRASQSETVLDTKLRKQQQQFESNNSLLLELGSRLAHLQDEVKRTTQQPSQNVSGRSLAGVSAEALKETVLQWDVLFSDLQQKMEVKLRNVAIATDRCHNQLRAEISSKVSEAVARFQEESRGMTASVRVELLKHTEQQREEIRSSIHRTVGELTRTTMVDIESLNRSSASLKNQLDELRQSNIAWLKDVQNASLSPIQSVNERLKSIEERTNTWDEVTLSHHREVATLQHRVDDLTNGNANCTSTLAQLERAMNQLKVTVEDSRNEFATTRTALRKEAEDQWRKQDKAIAALNTQVIDLKAGVTLELRGEIESAKEDNRSRVSSCETTLNEEIAACKSEILSVKKNAMSAAAETKKDSVVVQKCYDMCSRIADDILILKEENSEFRKLKDRVQAVADTCTSFASDVAQSKKVAEKVAQLNSSIVTLESEFEKQQGKKLNEKFNQIASALEAMESEIGKLQKGIVESQRAIDVVSDTRSELAASHNNSISLCKKEIQSFDSRLDNMRKELELFCSHEVREVCDDRLSGISSKLEEFKDNKPALDRDALNLLKASMKERIESIRKEANTQAERTEDLLKRELSNLQHRLSDGYSSDLSKMNDKIDTAKREMERIEEALKKETLLIAEKCSDVARRDVETVTERYEWMRKELTSLQEIASATQRTTEQLMPRCESQSREVQLHSERIRELQDTARQLGTTVAKIRSDISGDVQTVRDEIADILPQTRRALQENQQRIQENADALQQRIFKELATIKRTLDTPNELPHLISHSQLHDELQVLRGELVKRIESSARFNDEKISNGLTDVCGRVEDIDNSLLGLHQELSNFAAKWKAFDSFRSQMTRDLNETKSNIAHALNAEDFGTIDLAVQGMKEKLELANQEITNSKEEFDAILSRSHQLNRKLTHQAERLIAPTNDSSTMMTPKSHHKALSPMAFLHPPYNDQPIHRTRDPKNMTGGEFHLSQGLSPLQPSLVPFVPPQRAGSLMSHDQTEESESLSGTTIPERIQKYLAEISEVTSSRATEAQVDQSSTAADSDLGSIVLTADDNEDLDDTADDDTNTLILDVVHKVKQLQALRNESHHI